jgi:hypothetical protein
MFKEKSCPASIRRDKCISSEHVVFLCKISILYVSTHSRHLMFAAQIMQQIRHDSSTRTCRSRIANWPGRVVKPCKTKLVSVQFFTYRESISFLS